MSEEIWKEFWTEWVAENGLARLVSRKEELDMGDWRNQDQMGLGTVKNDNGILFLAYFIAICKVLRMNEVVQSKRTDVALAVERLERLPCRGLFNRQPAGKETPEKLEAHDNYVGISYLSGVYDLGYLLEIISYGVLSGWNYNNVHPKQWDIKCQRQPGEIAFYNISAKRTPEIIGFIHLMIGIIINCFKHDAGQNMLTWLRLLTMDQVASQNVAWVKFPILIVSQLWILCMNIRWGHIANLFGSYFQKNHPINTMARKIEGGYWGF